MRSKYAREKRRERKAPRQLIMAALPRRKRQDL